MELKKKEALLPKNKRKGGQAGSSYLLKSCTRLQNFPRKGIELGMRRNGVRKAEK